MADEIQVEVVDDAVVKPATESGVVSAPASQQYTNDRIESLEEIVLKLPQVDVPLFHSFAPGVYIREVVMPKGTFVLGHCHKTEHFNIALSGRAAVMMDGVVHHVTAPAIIKSGPGVRKVFYIHEDMRWATVHPTNETDVQKLEKDLVTPSHAFTENELKQLREAAEL